MKKDLEEYLREQAITVRPGSGVIEPTKVIQDGRVIEVHHIHDQPAPTAYRGDDLLRRFVPYFVITIMGMVLVGGIIGLLGLVIPMIFAMILALVASFVSIILSLVATIFAGVIIALAITHCQTMNGKQGKTGRGR